MATIEQVLERRTPELMRIPGVRGVGEGACEDRPCIHVFVADSTSAERLPRTLDGYTVFPVISGMFTPRG